MAPSSQPCCPSCSQTVQPAAGPVQEIRTTDSRITPANRLDHFLARWGVDRMGHRVEPGLYRLGNPTEDSPVFASANYTLSFDALRSALAGHDGYILVLDTNGINVWCAAGKGTFGTDEIVRRITLTGLASVVRHRTLIAPQLSAPGVSAHEVLRRSGFKVEYGPVRASDLPEYLAIGRATPDMRRVRFPAADRLVLAPMELVHAALPTVAGAIVLYLLAGLPAALGAVAAVLAGTVLFPALLPFIPTRDFSTKGLILGGIVALPFSAAFFMETAASGWAGVPAALAPLLLMPPVTAYLALNFTGSTPFTSRTGVKKEIFRYVPFMAGMAVFGVALAVVLGVARLLGVV
ncbi:MAG: mercury methylation corrinoid protein HgcA [Methanoculleus sp.]|uniref:mercury methylation corrinoid protein HgcA n=1 Tax=Methanoculleus sp. TaxID=90427 RepID=UPI00262BF294|nr:mercury methylation corrinoid protein HgcA [Methanoculleus sp.]MCK9305918.1 carbon monoxide dehydrogenase [Methanoculleus sp.]MDD2254326.1 mercury methylation corrinoid protein HgcA [Methanoculleus sp.]MDD4314763.1 mercury methylation corrinoid protein HgcA [Methanoculleus sp.]MDD4471138.1 mercury methylation corrinoid protein HgcA [Methanoculleus sp.]